MCSIYDLYALFSREFKQIIDDAKKRVNGLEADENSSYLRAQANKLYKSKSSLKDVLNLYTKVSLPCALLMFRISTFHYSLFNIAELLLHEP